MIESVSFRDPGGYVSVGRQNVIRTVLPAGMPNLMACCNSPAAHRFVEAGTLIDSRVMQDRELSNACEGPVQVEHPRIPFPSYPHEWPADMLHAAAALTLELALALVDEGLGLKDATPYNVLFHGAKPVFIDVLSFETRSPRDPIWLADAQFARTFLIPLLLYVRTGAPVHELFLVHRDGLSPQDAVQRLPGLRRWLMPDLGLVTLPARASSHAGASLYRPHDAHDEGEARFILAHHMKALQKKLCALQPRPTASVWSDYETKCPSYSVEQQQEKRRFVERTLRFTAPSRVLDVGSNTGEFSLMAASGGASVVSIDRDPESVGALWRAASTAGADVLPLMVDFARPTPPLGWRCGEQAGFLERAEGYFDCVLMLAVMHHLMVTDQIPLGQIFEAVSSVTTRWLIIEYVGPQDPMFQSLARGRDSLYEWYCRAAFEEQARHKFEIIDSCEIPCADRVVYLMRCNR